MQYCQSKRCPYNSALYKIGKMPKAGSKQLIVNIVDKTWRIKFSKIATTQVLERIFCVGLTHVGKLLQILFND